MPEHLEIIKPDDWHIHLRDGEYLSTTVPHCAQRFARAIVMPNLDPPILCVNDALAYRKRILAAVPAGVSFDPLMTLYLTDDTSLDEIKQAHECEHVYAAKLYPVGSTTGADAGVTDIDNLFPVFELMEKLGLPLLIHGESIGDEVDVFDRERLFIDEYMDKLCGRFNHLKIVLEHITTEEAVQFILSEHSNIAGTITPHHLLINRNAMFEGGFRPHYYCLPVAKREQHRLALITAAVSENPKFFLGTDSAPHTREKKEAACGCAGIYSAHAALEIYTEIFENEGGLSKLEAFSSIHGPKFYGLPINEEKITLIKNPWQPPESYPFQDQQLIPFRCKETLQWQIQSAKS